LGFRKDLYTQYVSTHTTAPDEQLLQAYLGWGRKKYLPLLDSLSRDSTILELGCGAGAMQTFLKQNGFTNIHGIDISEEQIQLALAKGHTVQLADVFEYLDGCNESFDAIIALDFIEHFTKDEISRLITAIYDHLNPGGLLLLQTPNGAGLSPASVIYGDLTHMTIFSPRSLVQLLSSIGFRHFEFRDTGPAGNSLKSLVRRGAWKLITFMANMVRRIEANTSQTIWTQNMICLCRKPRD